MSFVYFLLHWSSIPSHTYLIPGLPPPLQKWLTQFRWLKPLGGSANGGYINPPIVLIFLMVGKESQGYVFNRNVFVDSKGSLFFFRKHGVFPPTPWSRLLFWLMGCCLGPHQAWMIRTHTGAYRHLTTNSYSKTRQGDRDGWVGPIFQGGTVGLFCGGGVGGGFMNIFLFVTLRIWVTDSIWVYFSDGLKPPTRIQPQKRPELRFEMSS